MYLCSTPSFFNTVGLSKNEREPGPSCTIKSVSMYPMHAPTYVHTHTHIETPGCRRPGTKFWGTAQQPTLSFPREAPQFCSQESLVPQVHTAPPLPNTGLELGSSGEEKAMGSPTPAHSSGVPVAAGTRSDLASRSLPSPASASPLAL